MNLQKEIFKGTFVAQNEKDLAVQLAKQSLFLLSAKPYSDATPSAFFSVSGKVKLAELTVLARQFAIMINAGITVVDCLEILKSQPYTAMLKKVLEKIHEDVTGGLMLSDAINKHKKVFPDFFRSMIKVGELSGKLELVLNSLADYYESDTKIKKSIKSAMSYPIVLLVMMVGIVAVMLAYIIPTFRKALSSLDITPTGLTAVVYGLSDFILANGLRILAITAGVIALLWLIGRTKWGKFQYARLFTNFPGIGRIMTNLVTARFARAFGLLLASGMNIVDAMENVANMLGNPYIEQKFRKAIVDVRHGMSLTMAFRSYKIFPQMMIQMVSVGEKTASLDDVMNRSCNFFDDQVETSLKSIASKIQPAMLAIMGVIVGVLFIAVYSPMLGIMQGISVGR